MGHLTIEQLRTQATQQAADGDWDAAQATLRQAMALAAATLADIHGVLGGLLKRRGDPSGAMHEYDAGFEVEHRYGLASTYNELNRLVERVIVAPTSLGADDPVAVEGGPAVDVDAELAVVRARLEARVRSGVEVDEWALGDLAVTCALLGDAAGATTAVAAFEAATPPVSAREKYCATLAGLASLDTRARDVLSQIERQLRSGPGKDQARS